ncbi:MAG: AAA-like domain-containing protein [Crocosphaera sp.]|nr:AAA-like domain-containing protein [Crocosphaera sp.]
MNSIPKTQPEFDARYETLPYKRKLALRPFLLGFDDSENAQLDLSFYPEKIFLILVSLCKEEITLLFHEMSKEQSEQIQRKLNDTDIIKGLPTLRKKPEEDSLKSAKSRIRKNISMSAEHFGFRDPKFGKKDPYIREKLVQLFWQYKSELVDSSMLTRYGLDFVPSVRNFINEEKYENYIKEPGSLVRIRSPRLMGKTFLINNLLKRFKGNQQYRIVYFTFNSCDSSVMFDYQTLMKYFCQSLIKKMIEDIEDEIDEIKEKQINLNQSFTEDIEALTTLINKLKPRIDKWEDLLPPNQNMTILLEKLLSLSPENFILVLDDLDKIFELPYCDEFCDLLRYLFQESKRMLEENKPTLWYKSHLIIAHSTESYANGNIDHSPLGNVGKTIKIKPFTSQEVKTLSKDYGLTLKDKENEALYDLISGHPYLVTLTFNYLKNYPEETLKDIIESACHQGSIYSSYLRGLLVMLKQSEDLINTYDKVVNSSTSIKIDDNITWKLDSLGLIKQDNNNRVTYFCDLYHRYFKDNL